MARVTKPNADLTCKLLEELWRSVNQRTDFMNCRQDGLFRLITIVTVERRPCVTILISADNLRECREALDDAGKLAAVQLQLR